MENEKSPLSYHKHRINNDHTVPLSITLISGKRDEKVENEKIDHGIMRKLDCHGNLCRDDPSGRLYIMY